MTRKALRLLLWGVLFLSAAGCGPGTRIPRDILRLSPESLQDRQMQTRRFTTSDEASLLSASAAVLQDLGFQLTESETRLGVIVASKQRDAFSPQQVLGAVVMAALFAYSSGIDTEQHIRASLVIHPIRANEAEAYTPVRLPPSFASDLQALAARDAPDILPEPAIRKWSRKTTESLEELLNRERKKKDQTGEMAVRVTFQRIIYNSQNLISRCEQINDPAVYQKFFDMLSQSVFLEAHDL
ncbi:MAG: hypothetical protein AB1921_20085 [Thermodesulfobacteriota bacterium]